MTDAILPTRDTPIIIRYASNSRAFTASFRRPGFCLAGATPAFRFTSRGTSVASTGHQQIGRSAPNFDKDERLVTAVLVDSDGINFGELPAEIDSLLQQGVVSYRRDPLEADRIFRKALDVAPTELAVYFCLYKTHTYRGRLDEAQTIAERGLREAAHQAGWDPDWRNWRPQLELPDGAGRFALYTLKALAFIHLRKDDQQQAVEMLAALRRLDPAGAVGWPVVAALAEGLQ